MQTYGELLTSQMANADSVALLQQAMMLPDGMTIDKLLSADEMARLNAYMNKLLGMDLTNPLMSQQMGRMKWEKRHDVSGCIASSPLLLSAMGYLSTIVSTSCLSTFWSTNDL